MWKTKEPKIAKAILKKKKNKVGKLTLLEFYFKI